MKFDFLEMTEHRQIEKANMLLMSKEVSDKDRSMKTQLLMTSPVNTDEKVSGEKVWKKNGFFKEIKPETNIEKANVPENTLL